MSTRQRMDSEEPDSDLSSLLGQQDPRYPPLPPPQQHRYHAAHDPRYSSDADASSDFSSLSEMDMHRDMLAGDYSDQELPLGGRWDLAAHWHLGDYSEGVEGDADDDDDEERDIDTDLSEGPGPSGSILLDLSRVHDILASIPSTAAVSRTRPPTRPGEPTPTLALRNGEPDSHSSAGEDVLARETPSIRHNHPSTVSPSERTVRFGRDAALPHTPELTTDTALPPVPDPSTAAHAAGQDDVHPDNYNGDMDDSQGDGETRQVPLPPMAAHNGAYMSAGSGRYGRTHGTGGPFGTTTALELRHHFGIHDWTSSALKSPDGDEPSETTLVRAAPGNEAGYQGETYDGLVEAIAPTGSAAAASARDSTASSGRHHRVISSSISSLPSFASSVFTPRGDGADGQGPLGTNKARSAVDYRSSTVYGLMEAMDVPMSASSVVTFWEGEIIDFENHTFWTRKWTAKARTDLEHWKRLEAFNGIDEKYIIRGAKTGKFRGHIDQKYIFMRWKEKHFVNASEHTGGLTIAGFYYLSMRRSDGFVEGYYHDQQSTPFQHLTLNPTFEAGGFSSPIFELA
ncbi:hypothetical protein BGZ75_002878 [Mortierella antarctica]|nr:hypothetical protein BGZ75_002878 [Mortierella antarctica]